jgi:HK97 family phage major capsid protein
MSWITNKHIAEKRALAAAKVEEAGKILNTAQTESRDVTAEEKEKFDALHAEAKKIGEQVAAMESQHQAEQCFAAKRPLEQDTPYDKKDIKRYSLLKAVRELSDASRPGLTGIEKEVSDEIAHRTGKSPQGFFMPTTLPMGRINNALDTTAGAGAIQTTVDAAQFIEILRNRMVLKQAGVRFIGDLVGNLALPKQTAGSASYWVADGSAPAAGTPAIAQVVFTPHICGCYTDLSRNFIKQSSLDAEMFARDDLAKSIAHELDRAGLNGSGEGAQPTGILQNSNVTVLPLGTNGGAPTWQAMVDMEATVAGQNADIAGETPVYIASPAAKGTMKTTAKTSAGYPVFLWEDDEVNGCAAMHTKSMPSNLTKGYGTNLSSLVYGYFSEMVIGQWGGVDVLVDPYTGSSSGTVRVVALCDIDIQVRHPESFCSIVDMVTT